MKCVCSFAYHPTFVTVPSCFDYHMAYKFTYQSYLSQATSSDSQEMINNKKVKIYECKLKRLTIKLEMITITGWLGDGNVIITLIKVKLKKVDSINI